MGAISVVADVMIVMIVIMSRPPCWYRNLN